MLKISKLKMGTVLVASLMTCALSSTSQAEVKEKKSFESAADRQCLTAANKTLNDCRKGTDANEERCVIHYFSATGKCSDKMADAVKSNKPGASSAAKTCRDNLETLRNVPRVAWATTKCMIGQLKEGEECRDNANVALQNGIANLANDNSVFNKCLTDALK